MPQRISSTMVQNQIIGLQRTQAEEVWIREDILVHILGREEAEKCILHRVAAASRRPKAKSLVRAKKELEEKGPTDTQKLVCIEREGTLEAILGAVESKKGLSPLHRPQKQLEAPDGGAGQ